MYAFIGDIRDQNDKENISDFYLKFLQKTLIFNKFLCRKLYNIKLQPSVLVVAFMLTIG